MSKRTPISWIDDATFHADVAYLESLWQRTVIGTTEMPLIDLGQGEPLVFVPLLEHFEFIYAHQIRTLCSHRRVILYRRRELRTNKIGRSERVEELRELLDGLHLTKIDLVGYASSAIVVLEFALRYPHRCRSLTIIAQGADSHFAPYPLTRFIHELYTRLPLEDVLSDAMLRQAVINVLTACSRDNNAVPMLPRHLLDEQLQKIYQWPSVYKCSIVPLIHNFDVRKRIHALTMPVLVINRADDVLAPEHKTRWLAEHLTNCAGYHIVPGRENFFPYSQGEIVTPLIESFLMLRGSNSQPLKHLYP